MAKLHYFRIYSATGIYEPNPNMDVVLLSGDQVVVRLLGCNVYASVLDEWLIAPGKSFVDLENGDKKRLQLRRNSCLAHSSSHATIYVNASVPLANVDLQSIKNSEGAVLDKLPHKSIAATAFGSVTTAISLSRFKNISRNYDLILDGYYAFDEKSGGFQKLFPNNFSDSYTATKITDEEILKVTALAEALCQDGELRSVVDLFSDALTPHESGHLHAFIAAWTGLEMFIAKQFKELQSSVEISIKGYPAHKVFSERMLDVMKDKYRLLDKFVALSNYYNEVDADDDISLFKNLKRVRDDFFHSMEGDIDSLPLDKTRELLEKYLKLYMGRDKRAG
ncbi:hypothetical protein [Paraburkholderia sp. BL21I4N1]|uniref:hypothetical protein n=1 Tax=Paraburkholderia sp. BL21I4N1 TaxID=1938801 RepID=UPI000D47EBC9|nr:hypothetical protein [Paraburkholderia sp. BL21I4N1]PQV44254.1 hypothetical protein B0G83_1252 [Paraburkholderia sp. BL21I4N1]